VTGTNESAYAQWNGENGHHWIADAGRRDRVQHLVADVLLETSRLRPGEGLLDIGCGAIALAASRRPDA